MSASPSGEAGGQIESVLRQILEQYLQGMEISSAAGDSPKINRVTNLPEVTGFGDVIDSAIQIAVIRHMEDNGLLDGAGSGTGIGSEGSDNAPGTNQLLGQAKQTASIAQNPAQLVSVGLGLLPHAALLSFAITLVPIIIDQLTRPGGEFDLRFKRIVEKEYNALQSRQTSYDINIGERGTIFQARAGLLNRNGGANSANSLKILREGGVSKKFLTEIDYVDHSKGFDI